MLNGWLPLSRILRHNGSHVIGMAQNFSNTVPSISQEHTLVFTGAENVENAY